MPQRTQISAERGDVALRPVVTGIWSDEMKKFHREWAILRRPHVIARIETCILRGSGRQNLFFSCKHDVVIHVREIGLVVQQIFNEHRLCSKSEEISFVVKP